MGELSTYALADFVPFSADVYFRLFIRHNEDVWPAHIAAVLVGAGLLWAAWRGRGRVVGVVLGACWAWVGYTFHLEQYASLNWAAEYFGWAFVAQGLLLAGYGAMGWFEAGEERTSGPMWFGLGLAGLGMVVLPLLGPLSGRAWTGVEVFAVAPDPTIIATFGLVLAVGTKARWVPLFLPVTFAVISGLTAVALDAPVGLVTPACALVGLIATGWKQAR